ncbi:GNAT family N-acetyltransferase [Marimonas lutisalis]|uniref:GNAT family N-acetyltransferase n=1 Tax=Marimonas lutisalis TaxID=2545756 RepID=UPI0010F5B3CA|nr:GNAT family N-acetyltransferase [Marimonas lutisalis]
MNDIALRQVSSLTEQAAVRHLCRNYRDFLIQRVAKPEIIETYYASAAFEAFLFSLPRLHARPQGTIFLAYLDHRPVGCCMTHGVGGKTCEIKRLYVQPHARGRGIAAALVRAALARARADGYRRAILDTLVWLTEAIELYGKLGFVPCEPFNDMGADYAPFIRYFERPL